MRRRRDGDQPQGGATPSRSENGEQHMAGRGMMGECISIAKPVTGRY